MTKYPESNSKWENQWKSNFNPDPTEQDQKLVLTMKTTEICHPCLFFK